MQRPAACQNLAREPLMILLSNDANIFFNGIQIAAPRGNSALPWRDYVNLSLSMLVLYHPGAVPATRGCGR